MQRRGTYASLDLLEDVLGAQSVYYIHSTLCMLFGIHYCVEWHYIFIKKFMS